MEIIGTIFIGIFTSIMGTILINFSSSIILRRRQKFKYIETVKKANNEIIEILKPYISEKGLPKEEIILSIISSISRKYEINENDLYSINIFCQELIKGIIDNVYVSSDKKEEYTEELLKYLGNLNSNFIDNQKIEKYNKLNEKKSISIKNFTGSILSFIFSIVCFSVTIYSFDLEKIIENSHIKLLFSISVSFSLVVINFVIIALVVLIYSKIEETIKSKKYK
ncbi:hypothetical protein A9X81_05035 [Brachyspira hyodysenteriae]|uniref:hypothetical protein n=1 Tax=Brachyspira hyodysenteriae TaxID=159 RepID=UPI0011834CCA|nr:hypothetical protein [Brachyspira hyodysenteriae]TVL67039.1 hypothetical protein A9X74_00900 [Brachyspira hyodysenteriae]TVL77123.1 hypothetical protein A9X81_05035 [Brachyspira hyodysenteriae]TVL86623.1 hypothetical protein A9X80_04055 [Brachyspira hyodysenteriae]